jgi:hypothetical protein
VVASAGAWVPARHLMLSLSPPPGGEAMATATPHPQQPAAVVVEEAPKHQPLIIFSHSNFMYWWPVWLVGFIMAALTWLAGNQVHLVPDGPAYLIHPSRLLGVVYTLVFFLVIMTTNVSLRGIYSAVVILVVLVLVLLAAYFDWWPWLIAWFRQLDIYMNMGFYVFFSTLIFIVWALNFFVFDRMTYWKLTPGQFTQEHVIGGAAKSYDTRGMVFEKVQQDLFRNWVLGLGTGDIKIATVGANRETMNIPNVIFVDAKVRKIQELIALHQQQFTVPPA